jgi:TATA-binding protein-associated factor
MIKLTAMLRLQRFKLNIASSVVTQQNAGLGSMNTGEVLDLFTVSAEPEPGKPKPSAGGSVSASKVLEGYVPCATVYQIC